MVDIVLRPNAIVQEDERYVEIYKITCRASEKSYVGQAVSHILNHGKYRPYGATRRFKCHVSEARSTKRAQCHYLNNAIRKYGVEGFDVCVLEYCSIPEADSRETFYIQKYDAMYPNGYNLKLKTDTTRLSVEARRRLSLGVQQYFYSRKLDRFRDMDIRISEPFEQYIRPLRRDGKQYGWYIYVDKRKADFGGVHIPLDISYSNALAFLQLLCDGETP